MVIYLTLCPIDGPRAFQPRKVNVSGSTMANVKIGPNWHLYDRGAKPGKVDVVTWTDEPVFVASTSDVMFGVRETMRRNYEGVL